MGAKIPKNSLTIAIICLVLLTIDTDTYSVKDPLDSFKAHIYSFGLNDPGSGGITKVNVYGTKDNKYVYEYKTKTDLKSGFLVVVLDKYNGYVEFEKSFDATVANSLDLKLLANFLNQLPQERIVIGGVYKDGKIGTDGNQQLIAAFRRILGRAMATLHYGGAYIFEGNTRFTDKTHRVPFQQVIERGRGPAIYQTFAVVTPAGVNIKVSSIGCDDPGPHLPNQENCDEVLNSIIVNGINHSPQRFGLNIVFLSRELGHVFATDTFDFALNKTEESRFASFVYASPPNTIVVGSVKGDASKNFGVMGLEVLQMVLGSASIPTIQLRSAYAFIGVHAATESFHEQARGIRQFSTADRYKGGVSVSASFKMKRDIKVEIISTSCVQGSCPNEAGAMFRINGNVIGAAGRGFTFVALNAANGKIEHVLHADTHSTVMELSMVLKSIPKPKILLGLVRDDAYKQLTKASLKYLEDVWIGAPVALNTLYDAYAFVGINLDVKPVWLQQKKAPKETGRVTINMDLPLAIRECLDPENPVNGKAKQRIYKYFENAEYDCDDGMLVVGKPDKCMTDGSWKKSLESPFKCQKDADECKDGTANCPLNSNCKNLLGSYECICKPGYSKSLQGTSCVYNNVCVDSQCLIPGTKCGKVSGKYTCVCNEGYVLRNGTCTDEDECKTYVSLCSPTEVCLNTVGSYRCKKCQPGFGADLSHKSCIDVDECKSGIASCSSNETCVNTVGSYDCFCKYGFKREFNWKCEDVNECSESSSYCPVGKKCRNLIGGFECYCGKGRVAVQDGCWEIIVIMIIALSIATSGVIVFATVWWLKKWKRNKAKRSLEGLLPEEDIDNEIDPEDYFEKSNNFVE